MRIFLEKEQEMIGGPRKSWNNNGDSNSAPNNTYVLR